MDDTRGSAPSRPVTRRAAGLSALAFAAAAGATAGAAMAAGGATDVATRVRAILPDLEAYVRQGMADWHVPGAALGVIVGDEVLLAGGYGVRDSKTGRGRR